MNIQSSLLSDNHPRRRLTELPDPGMVEILDAYYRTLRRHQAAQVNAVILAGIARDLAEAEHEQDEPWWNDPINMT